MLHALTAHRIDYATPIRAAAGSGYVSVAQRLLTDLPARWELAYRTMSGRPTTTVLTAHAGRLVRLDMPSRKMRRRPRLPVDRVIAVYGRSRYFWETDDADAIHLFLARKAERNGRTSSVASSGWLDVTSLLDTGPVSLPQRKTLPGMERFCDEKPGTFFFIRPVYGDQTAHPIAVEYGVLRAADDLWVERFAPGQ